MFSFQELKATYHIEVSISMLGKYSVYTCDYSISAMKQKGLYIFTLEKQNIMIDYESPQQVMDSIMVELTGALYPIILIVTPYREIVSVKNFEEIRSRWKKRALLISQRYDSPIVDEYIEDSARNIVKESSFLQAFKKDSFVLNYFLSLKDTFEYIVPDIGNNNEVLYLICKKNGILYPEVDRVSMDYDIMTGEFEKEKRIGNMICEMNEEDVLLSFKCNLNSDNISGEKNISIERLS